MPPAERRVADQFESLLADVFRKAGWRVRRFSSAARDTGADIVLDQDGNKYVVELKVSSEGRRDRLLPLLSQAVLQARASAQSSEDPALPMAVVAAKYIPASVAAQVQGFAKRYAPDVETGVIDAEGLRAFTASGLERLNTSPTRRRSLDVASAQSSPELFSDLNQWMLKILLGHYLPDSLISVPRQPIRNATQLAEAATVSIMTASRLLNQLSDRGFLSEDEERLRVVRVEELLDRWIAANRDRAKEIPARWVIRRGADQLRAALKEYEAPAAPSAASRRNSRSKPPLKILPRCCLALFAAADALGYGFVEGVPSHIYLERLTLDVLGRLGLMVDHSDRPADIYIRVPVNRESIFRASIIRDGIRASDVLQVWLDVSTHPTRGREQAREIHRRALSPLFAKQG